MSLKSIKTFRYPILIFFTNPIRKFSLLCQDILSMFATSLNTKETFGFWQFPIPMPKISKTKLKDKSLSLPLESGKSKEGLRLVFTPKQI